MKGFFNTVLLLYLISPSVTVAQNNADDIIGYYLSIDPFNQKKSQNYIYKTSDNTYEGVVAWMEDTSLQHLVGFKFLTGLTFNKKENEWQNGVLKYPDKGIGPFKAYMSFPDGLGRLKLRGYMGVSLFGKTVYWTRENKR